MTQHTNKFQNIQALRGIAVMLVVFFHLTFIENKYGHGLTILPHIFNVGAAGVDIFFVISGFIMIAVTQNQFQKQNAVTHFLAHRITRIYPLYWFYNVLVLLVMFIHPSWINQSQDHQYDFVRSFLLLPMSEWQLLLVGWTLIHEMYFYVVIALLLFFPEKHLPKLLCIWLAFVIVSNLCINSDSPTIIIMSHPLTCEFIAGCFITRLLFISNKIPAWIILITGSILLLVAYSCYYHYSANLYPYGWIRIGLFGIPSFLLVYAGVALERNAVLLPRILCKLGDASYSIYLSHILVLSALGRIFALTKWHNLFTHIVALTLMLITVIVVGKMSYYFIEKPLINFFRDKINYKFSLMNYWKLLQEKLTN